MEQNITNNIPPTEILSNKCVLVDESTNSHKKNSLSFFTPQKTILLVTTLILSIVFFVLAGTYSSRGNVFTQQTLSYGMNSVKTTSSGKTYTYSPNSTCQYKINFSGTTWTSITIKNEQGTIIKESSYPITTYSVYVFLYADQKYKITFSSNEKGNGTFSITS